MEAKELMIGDWVYNKNIDKPMQVYPMMFSQMFRQKPDAKTEDYNIFPIPLTAEILEKNGFRNIGGHWYDCAADYYELEVEAYCDSIWRVFYHSTEFNIGDERVFVSHIHELQHALRLFGIKREIEL